MRFRPAFAHLVVAALVAGGPASIAKPRIDEVVAKAERVARKGNTEKAERLIDQALERDPKHAYALWLKARLRYRAHDPEGALATIDRFIEVAPGSPTPHAWRALYLCEQGDAEGCLDSYDHAIERAPMMADAYFERGKVLLAVGRSGDARRDLEKAIELGADETRVLASIARTFARSGDVDTALREMDRLVVLSEESAQAYYSRGRLKLELGYSAESASDLEKAIELDERYVDAYVELAYALVIEGKCERAKDLVADWPKNSRYGSNSWNNVTWLDAALIPEHCDRRVSMEFSLERAERGVEERPYSAALRGTLAMVLYRVGRFDDAMVELRRSSELALGETSPANLFQLALLHAAKGQRADARAAYDRGVDAMRRFHAVDPATPTLRAEAERALGLAAN
ncbi:MAG: tetratricopeptide repeat protein [bacterium]|nr:tetratricopeptide repeat protein [bacterium]